MSYILDALRRAEQERAAVAGAPPPLEAAPGLLAGTEVPGARPAPRRVVPWLALAVLAGLAGAGLWWYPGPAPVSPPMSPPASPSASPSVSTPAPPAAAALPLVLAAPPRAAAPSSAGGSPQPEALPVPADMPAPPAGAEPQAPQPARPTSVAAAPPPPLTALPEAVRRALPPLRFEGTVYAADPADRLLMLNGHLLREGEAFSTEITVESIGPRSAVLRARGQRFTLARE